MFWREKCKGVNSITIWSSTQKSLSSARKWPFAVLWLGPSRDQSSHSSSAWRTNQRWNRERLRVVRRNEGYGSYTICRCFVGAELHRKLQNCKRICIFITVCICAYKRREFSNLTSDNMDRCSNIGDSSRKRERKKREDQRRERQKKCFVVSEGRKVGWLKRRVRSHLGRFEVKRLKTPHIRSYFASWDVGKVQAAVARSTFASQKCSKLTFSDHFWALRCWKRARNYNYNSNYTTLHQTTTTLHHTKLHYTHTCSYTYTYNHNYNYTTTATRTATATWTSLHYNYNYNSKCNSNYTSLQLQLELQLHYTRDR